MNLAAIVDTTTPSIAQSDVSVCCGASDNRASCVGQDRLSDSEREAAIARAGSLMERRYADYAATGCFAALGDAHKAMKLQRELIAGRSPEQVARMERERGLV